SDLGARLSQLGQPRAPVPHLRMHFSAEFRSGWCHVLVTYGLRSQGDVQSPEWAGGGSTRAPWRELGCLSEGGPGGGQAEAARRGATVLVGGRNFGCGAGGGHAVGGVMLAGYRASIAPGQGEGFADIFESNAFHNGLLVLELNQDDWQPVVTAGRDHPGQAEV